MAVKVKRYDSIDPGRFMTTPFTKTGEGFLTGRAIVTNVGVFTYKNRDGSEKRELRPPEEVFATDSLNSMKLKPMCNDHPSEKVTSANAKDLQIGSLGNNPSDWISSYANLFPESVSERGSSASDGFHVAIDLTITDAASIKDIEEKSKYALSMGYECEIDETSGVWCGVAYDCIQRNIMYNHCALVDGARAGDAARIRFDSKDIHLDGGDAVLVNIPHSDGEFIAINQEDKAMKKIRIDGIEYEGDEGLCNAFNSEKKRADAAETKLDAYEKDSANAKAEKSKLEADLDTAKDRADKAEAELKEAQASLADPKRVDAAIAEKLAIREAANKAGVEVKSDMSDNDIRQAVILKVFPEAKLDGKDEAYISARFDATVEFLRTRADGKSRVVASENYQGQGRRDSDAAHQDMVDKLYKMSNGLEDDADIGEED